MDRGKFRSAISLQVPLSAWVLLLVVLVLFLRLIRISKGKAVPDCIPRVGWEKQWFSIIRASTRDLKKGFDLAEEGYRKYGKNGLGFTTVTMWLQPTIVLPPSDTQWLVDRPHDDVVQPIILSHMGQKHHYLPWLPKNELFHASAIRVDLKRFIATHASEMWRKIGASVDEMCGSDIWKTVDVSEVAKAVAIRSIIRAFVGEELSDDASFAADLCSFSKWFNGTIIPLFLLVPDALKPLVAPIAALPARYYVSRLNRKVIPIIERLQAAQERDKAKGSDAEVCDLVHCHVAAARHKPDDQDPYRIASRLFLLMGAAAFDTLSTAFSNALLDMASGATVSTGAGETALTEHHAVIRQEVEAVLHENGGSWTPKSMQALAHTDSFLRETMRRRTFLARQVYRVVVKDGGLQLPERSCGSGVVVPRGTWLALSAAPVHWDDDMWADARAFKAWRFVDKAADPPATLPNCSMPTPTESFLSFGKGRHTCPGRFFAADVMKLALAYIALEYDIRPLGERPQNVTVGDTSIPAQAKIEVRRRRRHI